MKRIFLTACIAGSLLSGVAFANEAPTASFYELVKLLAPYHALPAFHSEKDVVSFLKDSGLDPKLYHIVKIDAGTRMCGKTAGSSRGNLYVLAGN